MHETNIGFFKRVEPYLIDYINGKASFDQTIDHCNDTLVEMKLEKLLTLMIGDLNELR